MVRENLRVVFSWYLVQQFRENQIGVRGTRFPGLPHGALGVWSGDSFRCRKFWCSAVIPSERRQGTKSPTLIMRVGLKLSRVMRLAPSFAELL
jgi:hypothetical protein